MSLDYWLGLATLPAAAAILFALFVAWVRGTMLLDERWGITFEAKVRDTSKVSDYTIKHDIWWERHVGPVFFGGWCHNYYYDGQERLRVNRWIGLGFDGGPCVAAYKSRDLGPVEG